MRYYYCLATRSLQQIRDRQSRQRRRRHRERPERKVTSARRWRWRRRDRRSRQRRRPWRASPDGWPLRPPTRSESPAESNLAESGGLRWGRRAEGLKEAEEISRGLVVRWCDRVGAGGCGDSAPARRRERQFHQRTGWPGPPVCPDRCSFSRTTAPGGAPL